MSPVTITRSFGFDSGHRVLGHESKCAHLHGHRYTAEVTFRAPDLDGLGRVIDFSVVKELVGNWIDEHLDHNMLLHPDDPLAALHRSGMHDVLFGCKAPYMMPQGRNPTAEHIAEEIFVAATELLRPKGVKVLHVRLYETPNCWADYYVPS